MTQKIIFATHLLCHTWVAAMMPSDLNNQLIFISINLIHFVFHLSELHSINF